jgi:hypothetical protein
MGGMLPMRFGDNICKMNVLRKDLHYLSNVILYNACEGENVDKGSTQSYCLFLLPPLPSIAVDSVLFSSELFIPYGRADRCKSLGKNSQRTIPDAFD